MDKEDTYYINRVKTLLCCNVSPKEISEKVCYNFSEEQVDDNTVHFIECRKDGMSPYKALLFFRFYLDNK